MKEQIERDREDLRNGAQPAQGLSYVPLLKSQRAPKSRVKLSKLSTLNILVYLEEGFQKSDRHVLDNIEKIKKEVAERSDLFGAVLEYLENKRVRDDLFYWTPGYRISNIFCFIVDLVPNFAQLYKDYFVEMVVCRRQLCDALSFVKERFSADYEQFSLMNMDLTMFKRCISPQIWMAEPRLPTQEQIKVLNLLGIPWYADFSEDIEAHIVMRISFIDVTIQSKKFTVSLDALVGLILADEWYREYWAARGIDMSRFQLN